MKRTIAIILLAAALAIILTGCVQTATEKRPEQVSRFVQVERCDTYSVVYDKETKVMYAVSNYGAGSGVFTLLVDAEGSPKLWEE